MTSANELVWSATYELPAPGPRKIKTSQKQRYNRATKNTLLFRWASSLTLFQATASAAWQWVTTAWPIVLLAAVKAFAEFFTWSQTVFIKKWEVTPNASAKLCFVAEAREYFVFSHGKPHMFVHPRCSRLFIQAAFGKRLPFPLVVGAYHTTAAHHRIWPPARVILQHQACVSMSLQIGSLSCCRYIQICYGKETNTRKVKDSDERRKTTKLELFQSETAQHCHWPFALFISI